MDCFKEVQPWGITHYSIEKGSHISVKTKKAYVNIFTNPYFGRMVFIDGILQCSESDENIYHSSLVKYAKPSGRVLIAGGAEGATAREVFLNVPKSVVMVDWDDELIELMRKEPFAKGSFDNPLLTLKHQDILHYLTNDCDTFDCAILDLLDPHSSDDVRWLCSVCILAFIHLSRGGYLTLNAGGNYDTMIHIMKVLEEGCQSKPEYTTIFVPSFQEFWYLIRICKI